MPIMRMYREQLRPRARAFLLTGETNPERTREPKQDRGRGQAKSLPEQVTETDRSHRTPYREIIEGIKTPARSIRQRQAMGEGAEAAFTRTRQFFGKSPTRRGQTAENCRKLHTIGRAHT